MVQAQRPKQESQAGSKGPLAPATAWLYRILTSLRAPVRGTKGSGRILRSGLPGASAPGPLSASLS